jgi:hypothetical protein
MDSMARRTLPPGRDSQPGLPHDPEREGGSAYGKEVQDYTNGVASPPTEKVSKADRRKKRNVSSPK